MLPRIVIGSVSIPAYGAMLVLALVVGTAVAWERGRRDGLGWRQVVPPAVAASIAGVAGARLWSLVFERYAITGELGAEALLASSGLSVFGGLVLGAALAWATARSVGFACWAAAAAPGVATGIAIGRIGCLLGGCCHGRPTLFPIALVFDDFDTAARPIGVPLHATQLYESIGCAALAVALWYVPRRLRLGALLAGYGLLRALVEMLRADYRGTLAGLPTTTWAALVCAAIGVTVIVRARRSVQSVVRTAARTPTSA